MTDDSQTKADLPEVRVSDGAAGAVAVGEEQLHLRGAEFGRDLLGHQALQVVIHTEE